MKKANCERVTEEDINQALNESSLFRIRLNVNCNDFSEVLLFCRGESKRKETVSGWQTAIDFEIDDALEKLVAPTTDNKRSEVNKG